MNSLINEHRNHHRKLLEIMDNLRILLVPERLDIRLNAKAAHQMLRHLAELVQVHLSDENHNLYPGLITHQNAAVRSLAWCFVDGERPICLVFGGYHQKLLEKRSFNFSSDFLAETLKMVEVLERHIHLEENTLFPSVEMATQHDQISTARAVTVRGAVRISQYA
ncbi:Hemerythrin-like domain-containing protein [Gammaproteobacteria bacterium]